MSLYLCVFSSDEVDEELEGVEVGSYQDFHDFRSLIAEKLEGGRWGTRFPILMNVSDSGPEWAPDEAALLVSEFRSIKQELGKLPARDFYMGSWQASIAKSQGLTPEHLDGCIIDVDGEPLIDRLTQLAIVAADNARPISFQ